MKKLNLVLLLTLLSGLLFFSVSAQNAPSVQTAKDGSVPAITNKSAAVPLDKIKLPPGFSISVYAEVEGARSMVMSPSGTLFVGTKGEGKVYAVKDIDGDHIADKEVDHRIRA